MTTALLLVDVQRDMVEGPTAIAAADAVLRAQESLLASARQAGILIVHIQNDGAPGSPDEPDTPG
jgi:nicotinamidase-related amidase